MTQKRIRGEHSGLLRALLNYCFTRPVRNFSRGVAVPRPPPSTDCVWIRGKIHFAIQDCESLRSALRWKGAGGTCCCLFCKNIYKGPVEAPDTAGGGHVHHYRYALPDDFDSHTDESVWATIDYLEQKWRRHSRTANNFSFCQRLGSSQPCLWHQRFSFSFPRHYCGSNNNNSQPLCFRYHVAVRARPSSQTLPTLRTQQQREDVQQALGFSWDPDGVLADKGLREHFRPISHSKLDYMHILASSGGSFQYVLNECIRRLLRAGIRLSAIDQFCTKHKHSLFERSVGSDLFAKRYNNEIGSHFKGMASDTVVGVKALFWTHGFAPPTP